MWPVAGERIARVASKAGGCLLGADVLQCPYRKCMPRVVAEVANSVLRIYLWYAASLTVVVVRCVNGFHRTSELGEVFAPAPGAWGNLLQGLQRVPLP